MSRDDSRPAQPPVPRKAEPAKAAAKPEVAEPAPTRSRLILLVVLLLLAILVAAWYFLKHY